VLEPGTGAKPEAGGAVLVLYEGKLQDGTIFDSTTEPTGLPVSGLVPGFTEALLMMNVGGTYRIWLPPHLAYGAEGAGGGAIPPNAPLEFLVAVLDVRGPAALAEQAPPQPPE
jgi:FKBP-type peptidyl-prolyl cis-trans isomerase